MQEKKTTVEIKVNDVFAFRYNEEEMETRFSPYHCFDGQLVALKRSTGEIYLRDTYWGGGEGRVFTPEEAEMQGELTFKCNLDEVEYIREHEQQYYADEDVINLSHQHQCYKKFAIKKGATRSTEKMITSIQDKIKDAEREKSSAERTIERLSETLKKVEAGDLTVWI